MEKDEWLFPQHDEYSIPQFEKFWRRHGETPELF